MGVLANGHRDKSGVYRTFGATVHNNAYPSSHHSVLHRTGAGRNLTAGQGITSELVGIPSGNRHPNTWMMPQKAGALSSHNKTLGTSGVTLGLAEGRNVAGLSEGLTLSAEATLQLVVSMTNDATVDGSCTVEGNLSAALGMAGTSTDNLCTATATIGAIAWGYGESLGTSTASLVSYATGSLQGSISPFTELSPQGLADSLLAAAQLNPIYAHIRYVADEQVVGSGTTGDPWSPA